MQFRSLSLSLTTAAVVVALYGCSSNADLVDGDPLSKSPVDSTTRVRVDATAQSYDDSGVTQETVLLENDAEMEYSVKAEVLQSRMSNAQSMAASPPSSELESRMLPHLHPEPPILIEDRENYDSFVTNPIVLTSNEPTSTFSIDVDSGSYANMRRFLNSGSLPPADAVRVEELINYFSYQYERPESTEVPFSINTEISPTPKNAQQLIWCF